MRPERLVLLLFTSLSCFRLTRLITDDKITDWLRAWIKREAPAKAKKKVKEGIECPFCVSFWIAGLITLGMVLSGRVKTKDMWLYHSSIWGGSVIWNQVFVKLSK